ncbi:MAG: hypothetical protein K9G49_12690 [Taibaiella sp.]|nr:hypothetical protein [Taibaiella sp.]
MVQYLYFIFVFASATALMGCKENINETSIPENKTPVPFIVVTDIVKPSAKPLYSKFMKEVLLHSLSISCTRAGVSNVTFLAAEKQNDDSTWTYMLMIPASATGGKYAVTELLEERYGKQKAAEYQSIYASCLKRPPVINTLLTTM